MNWTKIFANAGLAFFLSMTANLATGNIYALNTSAIISILYAGTAFFTELRLECDDGSAISRVQSAINKSLLI